LGGLESAEPGASFLAVPSTSSYQSILDFTTSTVVRPTPDTSRPSVSPAAETSSTRVSAGDSTRGEAAAECLAPATDGNSNSVRPAPARGVNRQVKTL